MTWQVDNELVERVALQEQVKVLQAELAELRARVGSPWMTRAEAADYLRLKVATVDQWLAAGRLSKRLAGGRVLIPRSEVEGLVQ